MSDKRRRFMFFLSLGFALCLGVVIVGARLGFRINSTDSVPVGIYRQTTDPRAPYLAFCPPAEQIRIANERGYRPRGIGCADGFAPLLKPIRARAGDVVTVSQLGIAVNGSLIPNSVARRADGQGRGLPVVQFGVYKVAPDTVWAISSYNSASFDSRYFGPVSLRRIVSYAKPVWTF